MALLGLTTLTRYSPFLSIRGESSPPSLLIFPSHISRVPQIQRAQKFRIHKDLELRFERKLWVGANREANVGFVREQPRMHGRDVVVDGHEPGARIAAAGRHGERGPGAWPVRTAATLELLGAIRQRGGALALGFGAVKVYVLPAFGPVVEKAYRDGDGRYGWVG